MAKKITDILQEYLAETNIAELGETLEDRYGDTIDSIGTMVVEDYKLDDASREEWLKRNEKGLKLARQVKDGRTYAGETIADVKYPTIAAAAIQYAARAYPAIVKDNEVVKYAPIGADPEGKKAARGKRVAQYLNWELLENIDNWDEDMDKMLFLQPIVGTYFKKTYRDPIEGKTVVELIHPEDLVMYYLSASFEKCPRKTQVIPLTHNQYIEQVRAGAYLDVEQIVKPEKREDGGMHTFLEQHTTLDLDGDGYEEPYIITVHEESGKVVRIVARFEDRGVMVNEKGEVVKITPVEYFTEYPFMPSFDGGVYGMGFGILLGPLNESINTLFNQMLDAGTRSNYQSGFIGRGVRLLRGGESGTLKFKRGEWKMINASGDDLRKSIFPLPANEPSAVLFQLLGFLTQASKELSSQSELLAGQQQQHNVPATSTLALIEQGLQVFSGIYKRVYRSLRKEYKKVHRLDALHLTNAIYLNVIDDQEGDVSDFVEQDVDITPVSTSATVTSTQKYLKAQALIQMKGQGLDDNEILKYYLEALEIPNIGRFMPKQPPQPPPQFVIAMRELDIKERELMLEGVKISIMDNEVAAKIREMRERAVKLRADAIKALAQAESEEAGTQLKQYEEQMTGMLQQLWELDKMEEARRGPTKPSPAAAPAPKQGAPKPAAPQGPPQGGGGNV